MTTLFKILAFFRITDAHDNTISITSLAMYVSLYRMITVPSASYADIGALLVTLSSYSYKKFINKPVTKGENADS